MNLPVECERGLVLRLVSDVELEKWFGNPFKYLIESWDNRGAALVGAANETIGSFATRHMIEDLRIGYDVVMDMEIASGVCHGRRPSAEDGMWDVLDTVLTLRAIGLEERFIKQLFYKEYYHRAEVRQHEHDGRRKAYMETICAMADVASSEHREHERALEELVNAEVHDRCIDGA
jgi:hypothetical protein